MDLAFLNLGSSELLLILLLFVLLFGAEKVPDLARSLGRAKQELDKAQRQVKDALQDPEAKALEEQLAFEQMREAQMRAQVENPARVALEKAALELGLQPAGLTDEELKAAIVAKIGAGGPA